MTRPHWQCPSALGPQVSQDPAWPSRSGSEQNCSLFLSHQLADCGRKAQKAPSLRSPAVHTHLSSAGEPAAPRLPPAQRQAQTILGFSTKIQSSELSQPKTTPTQQSASRLSPGQQRPHAHAACARHRQVVLPLWIHAPGVQLHIAHALEGRWHRRTGYCHQRFTLGALAVVPIDDVSLRTARRRRSERDGCEDACVPDKWRHSSLQRHPRPNSTRHTRQAHADTPNTQGYWTGARPTGRPAPATPRQRPQGGHARGQRWPPSHEARRRQDAH